jgi:hypothetical protein
LCTCRCQFSRCLSFQRCYVGRRKVQRLCALPWRCSGHKSCARGNSYESEMSSQCVKRRKLWVCSGWWRWLLHVRSVHSSFHLFALFLTVFGLALYFSSGDAATCRLVLLVLLVLCYCSFFFCYLGLSWRWFRRLRLTTRPVKPGKV